MKKLIRGTAALAAVAIFTMGAVACSDDDDDQATEEPASTASTERAASAEGRTIEVKLVDFGFEGLPSTVPAGTKLTVVNESDSEMHELIVLRLPEDETRSVDELASLPEEEMEELFSDPPITVLLATPGGPQIDALGDGTLAEPGRYIVICAIPTGVDPGEFMAAVEAAQGGPPEIDGGPPHFIHGMYQELIVG